MKLTPEVLKELVVKPGAAAGLGRRGTGSLATAWPGDGPGGPKEVAEQDLRLFVEELAGAQDRLWASATRALLVVIQAQDAAGKDGTIKHVMSGVNPQGCRVHSFKQPSSAELSHDFLWRYGAVLPALGEIAIFNRSYYEEVLVVRVHPELLGHQPGAAEAGPFWRRRYQDINAFERHLHRNGTSILKIFLHVSKEEQRRRLLDRLDDPRKYWKFSEADLAERQRWHDYQSAYEEVLGATSTSWAPWYVVPADHKYLLRALVGGLVVHAIETLDLQTAEPTPERLASLARAREQLLSEGADGRLPRPNPARPAG